LPKVVFLPYIDVMKRVKTEDVKEEVEAEISSCCEEAVEKASLEESERIKKEKVVLLACHKKEIRRKLRFQFLYIIAVIVPYMWIFARTYDIWDPFVSLSRIGWRSHVGGPQGAFFLISFIVLTCPFMVYQVWFYQKQSGRFGKGKRNKTVWYLAIAGALFVAIGASVPYNRRAYETPILHALHNGFAVMGALLTVLAVTIILTQVCREAHREIILVLYGLFAASVYYAYTILVNAAAFQIGMTFSIFVFLYFTNRAVLVREKKKCVCALNCEQPSTVARD